MPDAVEGGQAPHRSGPAVTRKSVRTLRHSIRHVAGQLSVKPAAELFPVSRRWLIGGSGANARGAS
jgi:hypothetical protein